MSHPEKPTGRVDTRHASTLCRRQQRRISSAAADVDDVVAGCEACGLNRDAGRLLKLRGRVLVVAGAPVNLYGPTLRRRHHRRHGWADDRPGPAAWIESLLA
jgi:hypothetical protein